MVKFRLRCGLTTLFAFTALLFSGLSLVLRFTMAPTDQSVHIATLVQVGAIQTATDRLQPATVQIDPVKSRPADRPAELPVTAAAAEKNTRRRNPKVKSVRHKPESLPLIVKDLHLNATSSVRRRVPASLCPAPTDLPLSISWPLIYVDNRRKYIFCANPKVASRSWKKALLVLSSGSFRRRKAGRIPEMFTNSQRWEKYFPRLDSFPRAEIEKRLKTYYKFVFVREPLDRLVSAYRDKIQRDSEYYSYLRREIIDTYRKPDKKKGPDYPTFAEFVSYLLHRVENSERLDMHWLPQHAMCDPCRIKYDFIGRYESLAADTQTVLTRITQPIKRGRKVPPVPKFAMPRTRNSTDLVNEMYSQLTKVQIQRLVQVFETDYRLFGYKVPDIVAADDTIL